MIAPIILGSDENAYGHARIFYDRYGVKPLLLCSKELVFTSHSRILDRKIIAELDTPDVFIRTLTPLLQSLNEAERDVLLFPCSDYYAELISVFSDELQRYVKNPLLPKSVFEKLRDKEAFYSTCKDLGIPHPETLICRPSSICGAESPYGYPVVIKPKNSNSYSYLHADIKNRKKVYICHTKAEFTAVLKSFIDASVNENLIIQRYVDGDDSDMLTVNAYCGSDGKVRLVGAGQPVLCYNDSASLGNYAAIKTAKNRSVCDAASDFLEKISYRGIANFDLKRDPQTGKYLFFEINPRAGRSSYFMIAAGGDLITETVRDCIENEPFTERRYAEKDALWSDVSSYTLKKYVSSDKLSGKAPVSAVSFGYDFSPMRFAKLVYAMHKKDRLFEDYSFK